MAKKRYQRGHVFSIGGTWFGKYRKDVIGANRRHHFYFLALSAQVLCESESHLG
jgi:hypothetical protein